MFLAGSTIIGRATLHNEDELRRKDIRLGDTVIIEKAGEVIPAVVSVVTAKRTSRETVFDFPRQCPGCASAITRSAGADSDDLGVVWRCPNLDCPAQIRRPHRSIGARVEPWTSKAAAKSWPRNWSKPAWSATSPISIN